MQFFEFAGLVLNSGILALALRFVFQLGKLSADVRRIKAHLGLNGPADRAPVAACPVASTIKSAAVEDATSADLPPFLRVHHRRLLLDGRTDECAKSVARWRRCHHAKQMEEVAVAEAKSLAAPAS